MTGKLFAFVWTATVICASAATYEPANTIPAPVSREFRGAWIAIVANISWPSKPGLSTAEQKAELLSLLDRAAQLKLNAILFQARPACDALYESKLEPWSDYLTGTLGKAPEPFYDPLAFAIEQAHQRGLELHAWFNPYRAHHHSSKSAIPPSHISKRRPNLVREYGKSLWLDPGEKEVQEYCISVVMDVVKRYDLDGVVFDDYFYPYSEHDRTGKIVDFPDDASWQRFGVATKLSREDWRRENVNSLIESVYRAIKGSKPWVKFGLSPFGIWRPGVPASIDRHSYDAYAESYADARKWLVNGWLDYCAPQLYWPAKETEHSFPVLLKWWVEQNVKGRLVIPVLETTKAKAKWPPQEILNQIELTRKQAGAAGHIHWNINNLLGNASLTESLQKKTYAEPAIIPAMPWLDRTVPAKPQLVTRSNGGKLTLDWQSPGADKVFQWVLQTKSGSKWTTEVLPANVRSHSFPGPPPDTICVTAISRTGNASPPASLRLGGRG